MRPFKLLTFVFILTSNIAFGHQDFWMTKDFGNVKVRIKTGYQYEEIKKSWIIGELAHKLCKQLNYRKPVFIDFNHHYTGNCEPDYFISFDNGSIIRAFDTQIPKSVLNENSLIIREVSRQFTPSTTLRLLEYAISNIEKIKSTQKQIEYNQNYCQWKIYTIDTLEVKKIVLQNNSAVVDRILSLKIYRTKDKKRKSDISYFYQNENYIIFNKVNRLVLLTVKNIYQFTSTSIDETIVFDTDSTFYFVKAGNDTPVSLQKIIENTDDNYRPFEISKITSSAVTLSYWYYVKTEVGVTNERSLLYKIDTGELVQYFDKTSDGK